MVVVVDTSVFVAALRSAGGGSRQILRLSLQGRVQPLMGHKLFLEYGDVLGRPATFRGCPVSAEDVRELLAGFLAVCRWTSVYYLWRPNLPDEGDNHVVELAVAGGANVVITHNTADFAGELRFPEVRVVTPKQFLQTMR
jgi:putative PIN family toxin of toxin-antitoxin system